MKCVKSLVAMLLVIISLMSLVILPAAAAGEPNTGNEIETVGINNVFQKNKPYRKKNNTTAVYLLINSAYYTHTYVQAQGCSTDGKIRTNFTLVEGDNVYQVVCRVGVKYSVHSEIYEEGYRYASLDFCHLNSSYGQTTSLNYTWSPDSTREYAYAT